MYPNTASPMLPLLPPANTAVRVYIGRAHIGRGWRCVCVCVCVCVCSGGYMPPPANHAVRALYTYIIRI